MTSLPVAHARATLVEVPHPGGRIEAVTLVVPVLGEMSEAATGEAAAAVTSGPGAGPNVVRIVVRIVVPVVAVEAGPTRVLEAGPIVRASEAARC